MKLDVLKQNPYWNKTNFNDVTAAKKSPTKKYKLSKS